MIKLHLKDKVLKSIVVTCVSLSLSNGNPSYNKGAVNGRYPVDTEVTFSCNSGYTRNGCDRTTYRTTGEWGHSTPTCNKGNNV